MNTKKVLAIVLSFIMAMSFVVGCSSDDKKEDCVHTWSAWDITEASCDNGPGERKRTCSKCKEEQKEVIPVNQDECGDENCVHEYGDWKVEKEATCDEAGSRIKTCNHCNRVGERETIRQLSGPQCGQECVHDWQEEWHCYEGRMTNWCKNCEETRKGDECEDIWTPLNDFLNGGWTSSGAWFKSHYGDGQTNGEWKENLAWVRDVEVRKGFVSWRSWMSDDIPGEETNWEGEWPYASMELYFGGNEGLGIFTEGFEIKFTYTSDRDINLVLRDGIGGGREYMAFLNAPSNCLSLIFLRYRSAGLE